MASKKKTEAIEENAVLSAEEMKLLDEGKELIDADDLGLLVRKLGFDEEEKSDFRLTLFPKSKANNATTNRLIGEFEGAEDAEDSWYVKVKGMKLYLVFQKRKEDGENCPYEGKKFQALYKTTDSGEFVILQKSKIPNYLPVEQVYTIFNLENTTDINLGDGVKDERKLMREKVEGLRKKNGLVRDYKKSKEKEENK